MSAADDVDIGWGGVVRVETAAGSGLFFDLEYVQDFDWPDASVDDHEVSNMSSPQRRKEFIPGMADGLEVTIPGFYVPGSATHLFITAWRASGEVRLMQVDPGDGEAADQFSAYVKGYKRTAPVNGPRTYELVAKVTGAVTEV